MQKNVKVVIDKVPKVIAGIEALVGQRVMVGYPAANAERQDQDGHHGDITNAALGYIHEHGAPEANIPARPHLEPGIKGDMAFVEAQFRMAATKALDGNPAAATAHFEAAGIHAADAVKMKIVDGPFVALAPSTIAARERRGRSGEMRPLIDTGQLRRAVNWVLRRAV